MNVRPDTAARIGADAQRSAFRSDVLAGLSQGQKHIPSKYLYDRAGSALFDRITELPEYYLTRAEERLLRGAQADLGNLIAPHSFLVEYGAGSLRKVRLLLGAMRAPAGYMPIDISAEHLDAAGRTLARAYPCLDVLPVAADFTAPFILPLPPGPRVGFFPGSTLGNFAPPDAVELLRCFAAHLGGDGALLIGIDLKKAPARLWKAYNDADGVTAAFNRNLLTRINREIGAGFDPRRFRHVAPYDEAEGRVEMHLVSECAQAVRVTDRLFQFRAGEHIHTEDSYKYTPDGFHALAIAAGLEVVRTWSDGDFALYYLRMD